MKIKLVIFILMLLSLEPISSNSINNTSKSDDKFCLVLVKVESYINFTLVKKIYVSKIFIVYDKSNDHGGHDLKEGKICDAFKGWLSDNYSELIKNSTNNIWCNKLTFYNDYFDASRDKDALKQQNIDYEIVNTDWSWEK